MWLVILYKKLPRVAKNNSPELSRWIELRFEFVIESLVQPPNRKPGWVLACHRLSHANLLGVLKEERVGGEAVFVVDFEATQTASYRCAKPICG